jgi:hypothetical protein
MLRHRCVGYPELIMDCLDNTARVVLPRRTKQTSCPIIRLDVMQPVSSFICVLALVSRLAAPLAAQPSPGTHLAFDVASVKPNKSDGPPSSNFPLNAGDFYVPNGGLFSAKNLPLVTYVFFAY